MSTTTTAKHRRIDISKIKYRTIVIHVLLTIDAMHRDITKRDIVASRFRTLPNFTDLTVGKPSAADSFLIYYNLCLSNRVFQV